MSVHFGNLSIRINSSRVLMMCCSGFPYCAAVGAGVVAANTYSDGAIGVEFQDFQEPDKAVAAGQKAIDADAAVTSEQVLDAPDL